MLTRDLFDGVGRPHDDKPVRMRQPLGKFVKLPLRSDFTRHRIRPADRTQIPSRQFLEDSIHGLISTPCLHRITIFPVAVKSFKGSPSSARKLASKPGSSLPIFRFGKIVLAEFSHHIFSSSALLKTPSPAR